MIIQYKLEQFKESDKDFFCDMISYISPFIQKSVRSSDAVDIYCCEQNESDVRESIKKLEDMITGGRFSDKDVSIKTIDDHTLVALTIMIAESRPDEMEMMITVVMNCMK